MTDNPFAPFNPPKLTIELVPMGQWFDNLRSRLMPGQWENLKRACYDRAGHLCEICGGKGKKHPVECHEIWHFDDKSHVQTLTGLISLCPNCHRVKHIGNAQRMGLLAPTLRHLAKINEWPDYMAEAYAEVMMEQWAYRSRFAWTLNLDWLDNAEQYIANAAAAGREAIGQRARAAISRAASQRTS